MEPNKKAFMNLIDTHAHLYYHAFVDDMEATIARSKKAGIVAICMPNLTQESVNPMLDLHAQYPHYCYPMLGLHPCEVTQDYRTQLKNLEPLLHQHPFVAIGEIGIDLYWDEALYSAQADAFAIQVAWAQECQLPLSIHCRDSVDRVLDILEKKAYTNGILHSFTGTLSQAQRAIDMGLYLGLGGLLTFPRNDELIALVQQVAIDHCVLETDSPYLAPVPYRGKRNEPAYTFEIARKIAMLKDLPLQQVADVTTANAKQIFNLP